MDKDQLFRHGLFFGILALAVTAIAVSSAFVPEGERGTGERVVLTGETVTEQRDVRDFDQILIRGGLDLIVTAQEDFAMKLTGDQALVEIYRTRVEDGVLTIEPSKKMRIRGANTDLRAEISLPTLYGLTVEGAVDAELLNIDSEALELVINGAGEVDAKGRCATLTAVTNGAGEIDAKALRCAAAEVTINGAGEVSVYASEEAAVTINGVGDVTIYGNPPKVAKAKSGMGDIDVRGEPGASE